MTKTERIEILNADLRARRLVIPRPVVESGEPVNDRACAIMYAYRHVTQHLGRADGSP